MLKDKNQQRETMKRRDYIYFKPTDEYFEDKRDFDKAHDEFFQGELTEEFMLYCAEHALHGFWVNYKHNENKVKKEVFCQKFKELINEMLKEIK